MTRRVRFVMDATVPLAWCLRSSRGHYAERVLARLAHGVAIVPPSWHWEVASALREAARQYSVEEAQVARFVWLLEHLPIRTVGLRATSVSDAFAVLASNALSLHEATYVTLAKQEGIPLASADDAMHGAARLAGVQLLE